MAKAKSKAVASSEVIVEELAASTGKIGLLCLNAEKTLNSLTLNMVKIMTKALVDWRDNDEIKAVVLKGQGAKAFCAGGDVQALYQSAINQKDGVCVEAEAFFLEEYQLDYLIHTYEKPVICIGHGIVMGGGLGLLSGASHRVITDTTTLAMPEITIGLFPDVGGTYFLNRVPYNLGTFLALTGAKIGPSDTLFCNLADLAIAQESIDDVMASLCQIEFDEDIEANHTKVSATLSESALKQSQLPASLIKQNLEVLEHALQHNSLCQIVGAINHFDESNEFLNKAKRTMQMGSSLSLIIIYEQLKRYRYADLQTVFTSELVLASNMVKHPDFAEGVRALLIDKDKSPKWTYEHFTHIPSSVIESRFAKPWEHNPIEGTLD